MRKCQDRQRRISPTRSREYRAAGDEQIVDAVNPAVGIDHTATRARRHPGRTHMVEAAVVVLTDQRTSESLASLAIAAAFGSGSFVVMADAAILVSTNRRTIRTTPKLLRRCAMTANDTCWSTASQNSDYLLRQSLLITYEKGSLESRIARTGQVQRLTAFLGELYNGPRFPFDITDLRALDAELADACMDVLNYDRYSQAEIHTWGVIDGDELNDFLVRDGHYYAAQQRRIGRELYQSKFGERGHADEGLSG